MKTRTGAAQLIQFIFVEIKEDNGPLISLPVRAATQPI
jgi:hypothetical protein